MKLVFLTQHVDPNHPVLAQTVDLVAALAARVDELAVVARGIEAPLPGNATGRVFEASSRAGRAFAFECALAQAMRRADAVVAHMVPEFALLAAPLARMRRTPLLLWYTHWHASRTLRLATRVVDAAMSVDEASFPIRSPKLHALGHAIDVSRFDADPVADHGGAFRLVALGRTARWKGLTTLLDALELAKSELALEIRGPSLTSDEVAHRRELEERADGVRVRLLDPLPRDQVPALLAGVDAVVSPNEPRAGATLDKAVFEAAACRRPVVSTNQAFAPLLGDLPLQLITPPQDAAALAAGLDALAGAPYAERVVVGEELRRRVVTRHSVDHWADGVLQLVTELRSPRGTAGSRPAG